MPNPRRNARGGGGVKAFQGMLRRLNAALFSFSGRGDRVTANITRKDGTTTTVAGIPLSVANKMSNARAQGKVRASGTNVDK